MDQNPLGKFKYVIMNYHNDVGGKKPINYFLRPTGNPVIIFKTKEIKEICI